MAINWLKRNTKEHADMMTLSAWARSKKTTYMNAINWIRGGKLPNAIKKEHKRTIWFVPSNTPIPVDRRLKKSHENEPKK